jgi:nucleotide-binding universal stress UspA family protein
MSLDAPLASAGSPPATPLATPPGTSERSLAERRLAGIADVAVHVDGSAGDESRIAYAEALAVAAGAHLTAFQTNYIPDPPITAEAGSAWIVSELFEDGRRIGAEIEQRLRTRLDLLAVPWEIQRCDDMLAGLMRAAAGLARTSDVFVYGRPFDENGLAMQYLEAVLFNASSTVLVAPPEAAAAGAPKTILIGWRDSAECARAIAAARSFLAAADIVHLVSVLEDGSEEEQHREPAAAMARHLARHGMTVEIRHLPKWRRPGEGLINEAVILGADLIVAGAYGHSRFRERIFGGATRDLLQESPVPVLLAR